MEKLRNHLLAVTLMVLAILILHCHPVQAKSQDTPIIHPIPKILNDETDKPVENTNKPVFYLGQNQCLPH